MSRAGALAQVTHDLVADAIGSMSIKERAASAYGHKQKTELENAEKQAAAFAKRLFGDIEFKNTHEIDSARLGDYEPKHLVTINVEGTCLNWTAGTDKRPPCFRVVVACPRCGKPVAYQTIRTLEDFGYTVWWLEHDPTLLPCEVCVELAKRDG